jgi:23S rRNA (uridine2552-2'-O)-methyltransferase
LLEIHERFNIFKPGMLNLRRFLNEFLGFNVLDIGAAPGSWSQVAQMHVQPGGYILGIDLQFMSPLKGVEFLPQADITDPLVQEAVVKRLGDRKIDCVLSDMAPNPTGKY